MKTLCLTMIVKNESKIIKKCLDSIIDYIDYWIICDTGSTDGTQNIIKNYFSDKNINGKLFQDKWVNFGYNRTKAITESYKKADYIILLDADFIVNIHDKYFKENLTEDCYLVKYTGDLNYRQILLISGKIKWKYIGITHEYITSSQKIDYSKGKIDTFDITHTCTGFNRKEKFTRDIKLLKQGIIDEPKNSRYYFYLANSYYDNEEYENAMKYYIKRVNLGGWDEEIYFSLYRYALAKYELNNDMETVISDFLKAYQYRPTRLESLYEIILYYRNKNPIIGYTFGMLAKNYYLTYPSDILFVNNNIHKYKFIDELSICAYYAHDYNLSITLNNKLINLSEKNEIEIDITRIKTNIQYSINKMK